MKQAKMIAAAVLFFGLTLVRLLLPEVGAGVRQQMRRMLIGTEAVSVFKDADDRIEQTETVQRQQKSKLPAAAAAPVRKQNIKYVSYQVEEADIQGEMPSPAPTEEITAAFLKSQAAFADYMLPENVDYAYHTLPFDCTVPVCGCTASGFGYRLHPILNEVRFHYGTDLAATEQDCVLAFADGTVEFAGYCDSAGYYIVLNHTDGWQSMYAHCSRLYVQTGDAVGAGERIAQVGATGLATGPHLHFELTDNGIYVNPEYYISGE